MLPELPQVQTLTEKSIRHGLAHSDTVSPQLVGLFFIDFAEALIVTGFVNWVT